MTSTPTTTFEKTTYGIRVYRDDKVFSNSGSHATPADAIDDAHTMRALGMTGPRDTITFVTRTERWTEEETSAADFCAAALAAKTPASAPDAPVASAATTEAPAPAIEAPAPDAEWTGMFVGHWENDEIVVEYVLPIDEPDLREDDGEWEQGLFAAPGRGATYDEALAAVRAEYEQTEDEQHG
jgi:hypothetical protein